MVNEESVFANWGEGGLVEVHMVVYHAKSMVELDRVSVTTRRGGKQVHTKGLAAGWEGAKRLLARELVRLLKAS